MFTTPRTILLLSLRRKKVMKGTITIIARIENKLNMILLMLLTHPKIKFWKKPVILSARLTEFINGKIFFNVVSVCPKTVFIFSGVIAVASTLNWLTIFGSRNETKEKITKPVSAKTISTERVRGTLFFSMKSTTGLNIIAINREIISIAIISEMRYAKYPSSIKPKITASVLLIILNWRSVNGILLF